MNKRIYFNFTFYQQNTFLCYDRNRFIQISTCVHTKIRELIVLRVEQGKNMGLYTLHSTFKKEID